LIANVGQNRFEALDVAVDIAYEGSFHALNHRRWPDQLEGGSLASSSKCIVAGLHPQVERWP
jgi:hypothetical protein